MISFESDYVEGAHPQILEALTRTNTEQLPGYGEDFYCLRAKEKIRKACGRPDADVFFMSGGTQTNMIVISALLREYEGVIAASTGHIAVHEAGAIEYTGHKVFTLPAHEGKMKAYDLRALMETFYADGSHEHMPFPGMVYISYPTEYGTLYKRSELEEICSVCREYSIPFFIDGARLGYGLMSPECDLTLPVLASLCDVFYIGGTKVGALCGEAVVFTNLRMPKHFLTHVKQKGGLLAKGRLLGVQFDALFTDDLYFKISAHAISAAMKIKEIFLKKGYRLFIDSPTNQQFVIIDDLRLEELEKQVRFSVWQKYDNESTVVRFASSFMTPGENIQFLDTIL